MTQKQLIQAKMQRLAELRQYQAYYGPATPYPIIAEINRLETELRRVLHPPKPHVAARTNGVKKPGKLKKPQPPFWQFWKLSRATKDLIATIAFIGLVFLFGSIIFAAYVQIRPGRAVANESGNNIGDARPTLRPTFTPTPPAGEAAAAAYARVSAASDAVLPTPGSAPTDIPTPVPTLTPTNTPPATSTFTPTPSPLPTTPPPPLPTATPAPPTPPPAPSFPFMVAEQGNRIFQKTTYHVITIYVAVVSEGNVPLGGFKVVGDHTPSGQHIESDWSTWNWSVVNCLDCDYKKFGNLKLEPGTFTDGVWNIYLTDASGTQLSPVVPLQYSADPEKWVWDFIIFRRKNG